MSASRTPRQARRGFTLIEAVVVVLVLSISVPTTLLFTDAAVSRRADSVSAIRATTYATAVMETVLADVSSASAGRGFVALATPSTYLDGPQGLWMRTAGVTSGYRAQGMTCTVGFGPIANAAGTTTGLPAVDLFRAVDVRVSFPLADGGMSEVALSGMVTQW